MYKAVTILFFCIIFAAHGIFAQTNLRGAEKMFYSLLTSNAPVLANYGPNPIVSVWTLEDPEILPYKICTIKPEISPKFTSPKSILQPAMNNTLPVIPASFYADNLSFFCEKEWKFEKATSIPFKFRLGSVSQVDFLEGKPNAVGSNY